MLTWDRRENDELTAAGYARSGRVARAVEVSAEAVYGGLPGQQQEIARDVFSGDGSTLATAGGDGTARLWDVAFPAGLLGAVCTIAHQSLTRQQWADYAGSQPFQQVCPAS